MGSTLMEERIKAELSEDDVKIPPEEATKLCLDCCKAKKITGLSDKFTKLELLSLVLNELQSVKDLPKLPALKKLDISENPISDGIDVLVENCPNLEKLAMSGIPAIKDLSCLEPLKKLEKLRKLELTATPLSKEQDYQKKVFAFLPQLTVVDCVDAKGEEVPDTDEDLDFDDEDDDEDVDDEDEDVESEESDEESGPGLRALYDQVLGDDTEDFEVEDDDDEVDEEDSAVDEDDDEGEEEEEKAEAEEKHENEKAEEEEKRGKKRKLEDEEETAKNA